MEIFPKNLKCTNIGNNEYKIRNFSCFMGPVADACRCVAIFIKDGIKVFIRESLSQVKWSEMKGLNTEDSWNFFIEKKITIVWMTSYL